MNDLVTASDTTLTLDGLTLDGLTLDGRFDGFGGMSASGWVRAREQPERRLTVRLEIDGDVAAEALADAFRDDLAAAGIGDGRFAFSFPLPAAIADGRIHSVAVRTGETGQLLAYSPRNFCTGSLVDAARFAAEAPWVDAPDAEAEVTRRFADGRLSYSLARDLLSWHREGYVIFRGAIPTSLILQASADFDRILHERIGMQFQPPGRAPMSLADWEGEIPVEQARFLELHTVSEAAAEIALDPRIVAFCAAVFEDAPVAMQSLHFVMGSTQRAHMDFPYVHTPRPACLIASWVPLETVHEDAGPLFYYPGSHRLVRKFDFGGGNLLAFEDGWHVRDFEEYLQRECEALGLERRVLMPELGDVLLWHSALVHGGSPRRHPTRTRRSLVTHYSAASVYTRDRRYPDREPRVVRRNGGLYYDLQEPDYPSRGLALAPHLASGLTPAP